MELTEERMDRLVDLIQDSTDCSIEIAKTLAQHINTSVIIPHTIDVEETTDDDAYDRGYQNGWRNGYEYGSGG